jgi:predicted transcriptional regulator
MSGEQPWCLAGEQAGLLMPTGGVRAWRKPNGLSLALAAEVLGISRRVVAYYESGEHAIPRTVMLACEGWDALLRRAT